MNNVILAVLLITSISCSTGIWLPSGRFVDLSDVPLSTTWPDWDHADNSWRNKVPSSGQMKGLNAYGCGPIRV